MTDELEQLKKRATYYDSEIAAAHSAVKAEAGFLNSFVENMKADLDRAIAIAGDLHRWALEAEHELAEEGIGPVLPKHLGGDERGWALMPEVVERGDSA